MKQITVTDTEYSFMLTAVIDYRNKLQADVDTVPATHSLMGLFEGIVNDANSCVDAVKAAVDV